MSHTIEELKSDLLALRWRVLNDKKYVLTTADLAIIHHAAKITYAQEIVARILKGE